MSTREELRILGASKAVLLARIAMQRERCAVAFARIARPLSTVDKAWVAWRQMAPFVKWAAVPLGLLLKRSTRPRPRVLGALLRWGPVVVGAARALPGILRPAHRR